MNAANPQQRRNRRAVAPRFRRAGGIGGWWAWRLVDNAGPARGRIAGHDAEVAGDHRGHGRCGQRPRDATTWGGSVSCCRPMRTSLPPTTASPLPPASNPPTRWPCARHPPPAQRPRGRLPLLRRDRSVRQVRAVRRGGAAALAEPAGAESHRGGGRAIPRAGGGEWFTGSAGINYGLGLLARAKGDLDEAGSAGTNAQHAVRRHKASGQLAALYLQLGDRSRGAWLAADGRRRSARSALARSVDRGHDGSKNSAVSAGWARWNNSSARGRPREALRVLRDIVRDYPDAFVRDTGHRAK